MTSPIRTDREDIYSKPAYIIYFLTFILFYNDFIGQTGCFNSLYTFHQRLLNIYFTSGLIKSVSGYAYNEIVT